MLFLSSIKYPALHSFSSLPGNHEIVSDQCVWKKDVTQDPTQENQWRPWKAVGVWVCRVVPRPDPFLTAMLWNWPRKMTKICEKVPDASTVITTLPPPPQVLPGPRLTDCPAFCLEEPPNSCLSCFVGMKSTFLSLCISDCRPLISQPGQHECSESILSIAEVDKMAWSCAQVLGSLALVPENICLLGDTDGRNELSSTCLSCLFCQNSKHSSRRWGLIF